MKKWINKVCIFISLMILLSSLTVSAESFTHKNNVNGSVSPVFSRNTHIATKYLNASSLGLDKKMDGITDICCSKDGLIYVLNSSSSEIIILNPDYTLKNSIELYDNANTKIELNNAKGIYVDTSNIIYVADTGASRILLFDNNGILLETLSCPESDLIPEGFSFQPTQMVRDSDNYLYVLSSGCFYGMLTFSDTNTFMGFYGANRVNATALDTFSYLFDLITSNDTKKSASQKKLPYSFIDLCVDNQGYITACTGKTEIYNNGTGQIRKLSPTGVNIISRRNNDGSSTTADLYNFLENKVISKFGSARTQNVVSIECSADGFIYALDETYGLIYIYDTNCNLINSFGGGTGEGNKLGEFVDAVSFVINGNDDVLVIDAGNASITVYERTEYGQLFFEAQSLYLQGDYDEAKPLWNKVLQSDSSNQMAYRGLAMAEYNAGNYKLSLKYAEEGLDYVTYDLAYREILNDFVVNNFTLFFIITIALIIGIIFLVVYFKKHKINKTQKNHKFLALRNVIFHPFVSYSDIKYKKLGSMLYANVIVILFFLANALQSTATGFLFRKESAESYNIFYSLLQTVGLIVLWTVANWLVCTLFSGKGTIKEVYISSAYALVPLIIFMFVNVALSHVLSLTGASAINIIYVVVLIYTFYLLSVAIMTVHEYSFSKFILTSLATVFGMFLVVFIVFMLVVLLQQFWNLILSVYMEIANR